MIKFALKTTALIIAILSVLVLWNHSRLAFSALTRIDPVPKTQELVKNEQYAAAADYLGFFLDYDYVQRDPEAIGLFQEIDDKRSNWKYQLAKLKEGLVTGTSDETIGQTAGVTTDFLVVGDIRDLAYESINYAKGEDVDEVIAALSGLGLTATAAQVASGVGTASTAGAASPALLASTVAKTSTVALKTARKVGKLPEWLGKSMIQAAKTAKESKSLDGVKDLFDSTHTLAKTRGGLHLLSQTKNAKELQKMADFAKTFQGKALTLYHIAGDTAVRVGSRAKSLGKKPVLVAATYGKAGLRLLDRVGPTRFIKGLSRTSKMAYKGDIFALLAKLLTQLPKWLLVGFIALATWIWTPNRLKLSLKRKFRATPQVQTTQNASQ